MTRTSAGRLGGLLRRAAVSSCALLLLGATPASAATPDPVAPGVPGNGRVWELVTSPEPVTARLTNSLLEELYGPEGMVLAISPSGDRVAYRTAGPLPDASSGGFANEAIAERAPGGWSNRALNNPMFQFDDPVWSVQGNEGVRAFNADLTKAVWQNAEDANHDMGLFLGPLGPPYATAAMGHEGIFVGASPDLDRVYFTGADHIIPADAGRTGGSSIYESDSSGVHLAEELSGGSGPISGCGSEVTAKARDLDELFFTPVCALPHVYMRTAGHTVDVSASQCTLADCGPESGATYLGVSPDGSAVFFSSTQRLTNADNEGQLTLYRYDVGGGALSQVYRQPLGSTASGFAYSAHSSADGSRVYFFTHGQLVPGQGSEIGTNLYLADGSGLHLVAPQVSDPIFASTDGRYAVFATRESLDPRDTDSSLDVYRYDADSGTSTLISAGSEGRGNGAFDTILPSAKDIIFPPPSSPAFDGGRRIVFATAEALLPQDHNEVEDVYEWTEAGGLSLVSGGVPGLPATYLGAAPDGSTVLFRTSATLLPRDRDGGALDIYAARIGGGLPEPPEPAQPGCSECAAAGLPRLTPLALGASDLSHRLELGPIDAASRSRLARTGATTLLVEAPAPGRLTVVGRDSGHRTVADGSARAREAGPLRVRLRLERSARRALADGKRVTIRLFLSLGKLRFRGPALALKGGRPD